MVDKNSPVFLATRPTGIIAILFCVIIFSFLVIPVNASVIENRNFVFNYDGWTAQTGGTGSVVASVTWNEFSSTTHEGYIDFDTHSAFTGPVFANLYQSINVTGVDEISYQGKSGYTFSNLGGAGGGDSFKMTIGGLTQTSPINGSWDTYTLDVSSLSGVHLLKFELYTYNTGTGTITGEYFIKNVGTDVDVDSPNYSDVSWDKDPYYTGDTANITSRVYDFDDATYSYYLDLYNTQDYLTTYEITDEIQSFNYVFPTEWYDISLLAKLVRVTNPYATDEVLLAYGISHFETLDLDTTVSFNKSSYNPSEILKVTWSGAVDGSSVWLRAGDDGEVIEHDVAYSGSFTFNIPANTTETYYIVDVITGGYSQVQASCMISSIPDLFFNYSVAVDQDEYSPGDIVNVTYSTDQNGQIQVVKTISDNIYHSIGFTSGAINATGLFYITEDEPYGFYDVYLLDSSNSILDSVRYALLPSTSSLEILQSSVYLHESFVVFAQTVNESILSIEDPDGIEVWNKSIDALMYDSIYYTPTIKTGVYTAYLYDDYTLSDTILVYYADDPDVPDDDVIDDVIEDILEDDESMTDYFDDKFREFAPTAWGIFLLSIILWLMAILTSFGGSSKRR